jgi:hypothetical protein
MTVNIDLTPEVEASLSARAQAESTSVGAYLRTVIERIAATESKAVLSMEEFEAGLDALSDGLDDLPRLPPEAFGRQSIYERG